MSQEFFSTNFLLLNWYHDIRQDVTQGIDTKHSKAMDDQHNQTEHNDARLNDTNHNGNTLIMAKVRDYT